MELWDIQHLQRRTGSDRPDLQRAVSDQAGIKERRGKDNETEKIGEEVANSCRNFLFLFPAMLLYCFVVIVPFIQGIPYSFTNRASVVSQSYDFVGLRNYMELITNKYFQQAFFHTVQFTVIYVIGANVLGLALALMLSRSSRFNNLARTIMFIPFTVALTSGAIVWSYVFTDVYSPLFQKMSPLGLSSQVVPAMAIIAIWRDMGYCMLIYLAGLQSISGEYYEAAK